MLLKMLFVLFVGLKLGNIILWDWRVVCIPVIIMTLRWLARTILIESVKLNIPWAVKFYRWIKS